jgi:transcriptional/translational regulatory protein YebC/TACO1
VGRIERGCVRQGKQCCQSLRTDAAHGGDGGGISVAAIDRELVRGAPGVRAAVEKAKAANVPSDNIERAIKKFSEGGANLEQITYEAYGPGGCAMVIEALTDNKNKAAQEIKHILSEHGFSLAGIGSATWAFVKTPEMEWQPTTTIPLSDEDGEKLGELVDALEECDEVQEVYTNAE